MTMSETVTVRFSHAKETKISDTVYMSRDGLTVRFPAQGSATFDMATRNIYAEACEDMWL
jgi:hypothetical protein